MFKDMLTWIAFVFEHNFSGLIFLRPVFFSHAVVDEQNSHTEETELASPLEFRKDSEEENRDSEKDEDTKELNVLPCKSTAVSAPQLGPVM